VSSGLSTSGATVIVGCALLLGAGTALPAQAAAPPDGAAPDGGARDGNQGAAPAPVETTARPAGEVTARAVAEAWNRQHQPAPGQARAIGTYAAGCLQGAAVLPASGPGFVLIHPGRRRGFGHPALISFVRRLSATARRQRLGLLLVGDLSQARGGPTPSGHRSHQTGLDVDLGYAAPSGFSGTTLTVQQREAVVWPAVVDLGTHKFTPLWTERVRRLLQTAAQDPAVDRIFVNPAIKRQLCAEGPRQALWLARLRPWWGHHDHFHVRLTCPADSPDCQAQEPLPAGDDCAAVDWWFSADAQATHTRRQRDEVEGVAVKLPPACQSLLDQPAR
jgi:penicillin-insensitive murein endopeptidase